MPREINDELFFCLRTIYRELVHKLDKEGIISGELNSRDSWDKAAIEINEKTGAKLGVDFFANLLPLRDNKKPQQKPNNSNLDYIVKYLGYQSLNVFNSEIKDRKREKIFFDPDEIKVDELTPVKKGEEKEEDIITIGWYDEHFMRVRYRGKSLFEIVDVSDTINKQIGDTFYAEKFGIQYIWHYTEIETENGKKSISGYPRFPKIEIYSPFPSDADHEEIDKAHEEIDEAFKGLMKPHEEVDEYFD